MFTSADFAHLKFLEGRWKGTGPDGTAFYEAYDFVDVTTFRSRRYPDMRFTTPGDGSTVTLEAGEIISRWGEYSWRATSVTANEACFEPMNAPSSFCWRRTSDIAAEAVQQWTDGTGKEQRYAIPLERIA